jgi:hypothetical protein
VSPILIEVRVVVAVRTVVAVTVVRMVSRMLTEEMAADIGGLQSRESVCAGVLTMVWR